MPDAELVLSALDQLLEDADPRIGQDRCPGWCKASLMSVESNMNVLEKVFVSIENFFSDLDAKRRDAYLAESQNVADLERRLRSLDSRSQNFW